HWEVYSSLDRKVIAKITTSGSADSKAKLEGGSFLPGVLETFRENVRQLLASEDFRRVVTTPLAAGAANSEAGPALAQQPIALIGPKTRAGVASAVKSVAVVYAAD